MQLSEAASRETALGLIGISAGTASVLGLTHTRLDEVPMTAHVLLGEKCHNNCAFCAQASGSSTASDRLSRVTWPRYSWESIVGPLRDAVERGTIKRVCIQTTESQDTPDRVLLLVKTLRSLSPSLPVSVSVAPTSVSRVRGYMDAGATNVGLPVDCATKGIYSQVKDGRDGAFDLACDVLSNCAGEWPGRISTHLIVGLGETEEEAVQFLTRANLAGVTVGLFAFTPIVGTRMQGKTPPDLAAYRRIQLAAFHLRRGGDPDDIKIRVGRICSIGFSSRTLQDVLIGVPFETSGCSHCNRPYYNERPGHAMMNYPRALSRGELEQALSDSGLFGTGT